MQRSLHPAAILLLASVLAGPAWGQSVSSGVRGRVADEGGKGLQGAEVQVLDLETGLERSAVSDDDGGYQVLLLRPGAYQVSVHMKGYALGRQGVDLALNSVREINFTLKMAIEEHVQVSGELPDFDPSDTTLGTRVDQQTIQSMPLNGRQFTDLALLDSSVRQAQRGVFFGEPATVLTANGSGARSNAFLVDGSDNNDFVFGARGASSFSAEVIQEFEIVRDGYSAEFGRASGGVMNIITRSGTNEFGSSAFFTFTNESWNAPDAIVENYGGDQSDSSIQRQQFGFAASGPFVKDKAFYFVAYEGGRSDGTAGYTGVDRLGDIGGAFPAATDSDRVFLRTDFNLSATHYLTARLSYSQDYLEGLNVIGKYTPETGSSLDETDTQLALSLRSVISPNLFNEARLLWSDGDGFQQGNTDRPGVERPQGIYGGLDLYERDIRERQFQFIDNLTSVIGNHTLKVGVDVSTVRADVESAFNPNGYFLYDTTAPFEAGDSHLGTKSECVPGPRPEDPLDCSRAGIGAPGVDDDGDGIVDEIAEFDTYPMVYRLLSGSPTASFDDTVAGVFIQDEWRPHPNWNLNFGLRYDLETFQLDERYAVESSIENGGASRDMNNLAPRFSFVWTPNHGKNVIVRGGIGVFYDKVVLGFPAVSAITQQQTILLGFFQGTGFPCNEDFLETYGVDTMVQECILSSQDTDTVQLRFSTGDTLDTPYNVQWNIGFDRALGRGLLFGVNYVHARGYHVPVWRDLNPVIGANNIGTPERPTYVPAHLDPTTGSIVALETMGNTWYDALQIRLQDGAGDLTYTISYTLSRSLDQSGDPLKNGIYLAPDSFDIEGERARSDNDQRHRFVFAATWQTSLWGLRFSPVVTYASGAPFNVTLGEDDNSRTLGIDVVDASGDRVPLPDGFKQERPDGVGRNTGEDTPLDKINAARAAQGLPPYEGGLDEPDYLQVDLRISRIFNTGAGSQLEGFLQFFNLFNRENVTLVDGEVNSPTFGQPLAVAGPGRIVELGVRFGF
ncbi:MAG: TonB-dependent receptor [Acidobacteriota bacterium]|jgi:hypothetical protein